MSARERIGAARLYLVCDRRPRAFLDAALRGGVDVIQLRDKTLDDDALIAAAASSAPPPTTPARCSSSTTGPTWPRPAGPTACTSARTTAAPAAGARASGRSGSSAARRTRPRRRPPPMPTPTSTTSPSGPCTRRRPSRDGRPQGSHYVEWAAANVTKPWFAIGGIDAANVDAVSACGATRIVVVRAIADGGRPGRPRRARCARRLEGPLGHRSRKRARAGAAPARRGPIATRAAASATPPPAKRSSRSRRASARGR